MSQQDRERYERSLHGVQTGVAYMMERDDHEADPKHMKVGICSSFVTHHAVATLLIAKGVFTQDEYEAALALSAENERLLYEARVNEAYVPDGRTLIHLA